MEISLGLKEGKNIKFGRGEIISRERKRERRGIGMERGERREEKRGHLHLPSPALICFAAKNSKSDVE
jgi:hypothetical protein